MSLSPVEAVMQQAFLMLLFYMNGIFLQFNNCFSYITTRDAAKLRIYNLDKIYMIPGVVSYQIFKYIR